MDGTYSRNHMLCPEWQGFAVCARLVQAPATAFLDDLAGAGGIRVFESVL